jgi:hypothetical protein
MNGLRRNDAEEQTNAGIKKNFEPLATSFEHLLIANGSKLVA